MMRSILFAMFLLVPSMAMATGISPPPGLDKGGDATASANAQALASPHQDQNQSQLGIVLVGGDEAEDPARNPATPAPVYIDMCSSGVSVSAPGFGGSLGNGDSFCKKVHLSNAFLMAGDKERSKSLLEEAYSDLNRQTYVSRWLDWLPIIGSLF